MAKEKIGIASDHAGFQMKEFLVGYLDGMGYDVHDFGPDNDECMDYPDTSHPLALAIVNGELPRGVALCGSGQGVTMTLNKHRDIRAALCWMPQMAELGRQHNDANVCSLPARFIDNNEAAAIVDKFLATPFEGGRHQRRLDKMPIDAWLAMQEK